MDERDAAADVEVAVHLGLIEAAVAATQKLVEQGLLERGLAAGDLLRLPEAFRVELEGGGWEESDGELLLAVAGEAVAQLVGSREREGTAAEIPARMPDGTPAGTPVRLRVEQLSSVDHAIACGVPVRDAERRAMGIEPLPQNLGEAIALMERSELVAETLGEHVYDFFLRNKREEWSDYRRQVTRFELDRYLPML